MAKREQSKSLDEIVSNKSYCKSGFIYKLFLKVLRWLIIYMRMIFLGMSIIHLVVILLELTLNELLVTSILLKFSIKTSI